MYFKRIILLTALVILHLNSIAQTSSDTIEVKQRFGTSTFYKNGTILKPSQLLSLVQVNEEAFREMKLAKTNNDLGLVFGVLGGFMVGYPLGTALGGGKPQWELLGIGAGLIVISIPFSSAYNKHSKKAINLYNKGLKQIGFNHIDLKFGFSLTGIGIVLKI